MKEEEEEEEEGGGRRSLSSSGCREIFAAGLGEALVEFGFMKLRTDTSSKSWRDGARKRDVNSLCSPTQQKLHPSSSSFASLNDKAKTSSIFFIFCFIE